MTQTKRTIARDSVFRGTSAAVASDQPVQGIAPPEQPTRQTAVWLTDAEIDWLDGQCQDIRRGGWRAVTRSALIRALIRATMERAPDLRGVSSESEVTQRLASES
jgi:hypothetical protein